MIACVGCCRYCADDHFPHWQVFNIKFLCAACNLVGDELLNTAQILCRIGLVQEMIMLKLKEVVKYAEKRKWLERFAHDYTGGFEIHAGVFGPLSKMLVAIDDGKELGYIRLGNYSDYFGRYTSEKTWSITEAYVKPAYRSKGVLREMISLVVSDHNAKGMLIETIRYNANKAYYTSLGFTEVFLVDRELARVFLSSFSHIATAAANDRHYKQAA
jgi:ribosomal protein S18 acetylase RimI-like enzyme